MNAQDVAGNTGGAGTLAFQAGSKKVVQNLQLLNKVGEPELANTVNTSTPTFQWNPPLELPDSGDLQQGGIDTYEMKIEFQFVPSIGFDPFTDDRFFSVVECSDKDGNPKGTGDDCKKAILSGDQIRVTVQGTQLPQGIDDGNHVLRVRVISTADGTGVAVPLPFTVDTTPPAEPVLDSPDDELLATRTVDFVWETSTSGDIASYRLEVTSGDTFNPHLVVDQQIDHPTTGATATLPIDGVYKWRVGATDKATNETVSGDLTVRRFTVDTTPPQAVTLVAPADGALVNTSRPTFDWDDSSSSGDLNDYRLQVVQSGDAIDQGPYVVDAVVSGDTTQFTVTAGYTGWVLPVACACQGRSAQHGCVGGEYIYCGHSGSQCRGADLSCGWGFHQHFDTHSGLGRFFG